MNDIPYTQEQINQLIDGLTNTYREILESIVKKITADNAKMTHTKARRIQKNSVYRLMKLIEKREKNEQRIRIKK